MHLLVKEMIEAMYQGVSVIFASLDTPYDSVLIYMLQNGFTLLDTRFYTHFQYMNLSAFAKATHLTDPLTTLDTFLEHAVGLVAKDTKEMLIVVDHGSFLGAPYSMTTITSLAQLMVRHSENHEKHAHFKHLNQTHNERKYSTRHKLPESFSFVLSFDSHVMSSQELIYLLLNVPSLYIDNRIIPHDQNNILRVPKSVGIESLSSILNPLLVVVLSKLLNKSESNIKSAKLQADLNVYYKEMLALYSRCEAFQSFIETSLAANPNSLTPTKEIAELLATRPTKPIPYDYLVIEHTGLGDERDHKSCLKNNFSQADTVSPALSVNTDLSWMLSPDYKVPTSNRLKHPVTIEHQDVQNTPVSQIVSTAYAKHTNITIAQLEIGKEIRQSTGDESEKKDCEKSVNQSQKSITKKPVQLTTHMPNMGPYLEKILQQNDSSITEQPAVVLPAVAKRLTNISSLAWSQQPQEDEPPKEAAISNSNVIDIGTKNILISSSTTTTPTKPYETQPPSIMQSPPMKSQGLRMVTKGKGIKLSDSSRPNETNQAEKT